MSSTTAKSKNQPVPVTTGRGAAVAVTFGITLLTLGIALFIAQMTAGESYVLQQMKQAMKGLAGPLCIGLPLLLCWGGAKLLVSARHRVSARDFLLVSGIYLLILAGYTLIARVPQGGSSLCFMDYVGRLNYEQDAYTYDTLSAYLRRAYQLRGGGAGGLLGMLVAYPVWKVAGAVPGAVISALLLIVLVLVLFRINPARLLNGVAARDTRRNAKTLKEQPAEAVLENIPSVQKAEAPIYSAQPAAPAPVPEAPSVPAYAAAQPAVSPQGDFYTVNPGLYEEYFDTRNAAPAAPIAPQAAERGDPADEAPPVREIPQTPKESAEKERHPVRRVFRAAEKRAGEKQAEKPVPDPEPEDDLPWETEPLPRAKAAQKPVLQAEAQKPQPPASGSWAAQVKKKQAALEDRPLEMSGHTTARGEPKPVYTDPVMPLPKERIAISRKDTAKKEDEKLDGTLTPKPQQSRMGMPAPYQAPPMRLLNEPVPIHLEDAAQEDARRAQIIENTLSSFGVESKVRQITHGPAITRFAIQIAPGVKVSRVTNTADNLALDLMAQNIRVEAPIQGTSYIGIEVPNAVVSPVMLREVLDSPEMKSIPSPLLVALGKDIAGAPIMCDLSKMPHLLIAGATGSGKSVCINSIVCSLLYRTTPDQVRLIMIDPKQVELSVYNCIPHLLLPVISDPRKAAGALAWAVQEMLERYGKFSAQGVRSLAGYNKINQGTDKALPNIVIIIDEMADLMEVCRKDVEESIRRLAALARAAGIYMVLATQRPSVDVITGVIKNNIPSRIAFAVSSGPDSRTIIDVNGAEKLMGRGDMLYKPTGSPPKRVQGCLVVDDEVNAITEYISRRYETDYDPNIIEHLENADKERPEADEIDGFEEDGEEADSRGVDQYLAEAIEMAVEEGQTSTSMLQRRLRIGYARAGRLVDEMEKRGIVSHSEGSKPRKTLITREQYYENLADLKDAPEEE